MKIFCNCCIRFLVIAFFIAGCSGNAAQTIGQELGLTLLDGLLRRSKERLAYTALKRQIEIYEKVDPQSAALLKNIPTDKMVSIIVDSQENNTPSMGNAFLDVLVKNGIVVGSQNPESNQAAQAFPVGQVVQGLVQNIIQSVKPSIIADPIAGSFFNTAPSVDSSFPFAVVGLPQNGKPNNNGGEQGGALSFLSPVLNGFGNGQTEDEEMVKTGPPPPDPFGTDDTQETAEEQSDTSQSDQTGLASSDITQPMDQTSLMAQENYYAETAQPRMEVTNAPEAPKVTQRIRRPYGLYRITDLNQRAAQVLSNRQNRISSDHRAIKEDRSMGPVPSALFSPSPITMDSPMPSINGLMLYNTWQSMRESNNDRTPLDEGSRKQATLTNSFQPTLPGWLSLQRKETTDHVLLKGGSNVSRYRQRALNVQLPSGMTARLGDHGANQAGFKGSLDVPKQWLSGRTLSGRVSTEQEQDGSVMVEFANRSLDYPAF